MGIIKAAKLVHEYIRRDEDGKVEEIRRAVDSVWIWMWNEGEFIAILGHNGSGKIHFGQAYQRHSGPH